MKRYVLVLLIGISVGCRKKELDTEPNAQFKYSPIAMNRVDLENSIQFSAPRTITNASKIYLYGKYVFVLDRFEGIHMYDNSDIVSPQPVGFFQIIGCNDMSIKDNILYVDQAVDLVSIKLSELNEAKVINRIANCFPPLSAPEDGAIQSSIKTPNNTIIVKWVKSPNNR
jgi:hypothetical protein